MLCVCFVCAPRGILLAGASYRRLSIRPGRPDKACATGAWNTPVCPRFAGAPLSGLPAPGRRVFLPFHCAADWRFMTALTLARASAVSRACHYLSRITLTPHLFLAAGVTAAAPLTRSHIYVHECVRACLRDLRPALCRAYVYTGNTAPLLCTRDDLAHCVFCFPPSLACLLRQTFIIIHNG